MNYLKQSLVVAFALPALLGCPNSGARRACKNLVSCSALTQLDQIAVGGSDSFIETCEEGLKKAEDLEACTNFVPALETCLEKVPIGPTCGEEIGNCVDAFKEASTAACKVSLAWLEVKAAKDELSKDD